MFQKIDHVIILHGLGANPYIMWFPWLRRQLEDKGVHVDVPVLPESFKPTYDNWMLAARTYAKNASGSTLFVGHSLGGVLALRLLEKTAPWKVGGVVTVASPFAVQAKIGDFMTFFDARINWRKVKNRARLFTAIHAKNDPVVPYDHALRYGELLDAKLVLTDRGGHFTAMTAPLVLETIEPMLKTRR